MIYVITGPQGSGKSRLARYIAAGIADGCGTFRVAPDSVFEGAFALSCLAPDVPARIGPCRALVVEVDRGVESPAWLRTLELDSTNEIVVNVPRRISRTVPTPAFVLVADDAPAEFKTHRRVKHIHLPIVL